MDLSYIKENLAKVEREIWETCERAGRARKDVRLIAVSKNFGIDSIRKAKEYGQIDFGESRAQELRKKMRQFPVSLLRWHFIGPLQTNKVRYVLGGTEYVHSVDRWDLVEEMENRLEKLGIFQKILIEVKTSGEETKHGFRPDQLRKILEKMTQYTHMEVCGLMTMASRAFSTRLARIRSI